VRPILLHRGFDKVSWCTDKLDNHFFNRHDENSFSTARLQQINFFPEVIFIHDGVQRTPAFACEWHNGGAAHAGYYRSYFWYRFVRAVEQNILVVLCLLDGLNPEKEFVENRPSCLIEIRIGDDHCFGVNHSFNLLKTVAQQRTSCAHDVAY